MPLYFLVYILLFLGLNFLHGFVHILDEFIQVQKPFGLYCNALGFLNSLLGRCETDLAALNKSPSENAQNFDFAEDVISCSTPQNGFPYQNKVKDRLTSKSWSNGLFCNFPHDVEVNGGDEGN